MNFSHSKGLPLGNDGQISHTEWRIKNLILRPDYYDWDQLNNLYLYFLVIIGFNEISNLDNGCGSVDWGGNLHNWSWSWLIGSRSWLVSWSISIDSLPLVGDISNVSLRTGGVGHNLDTTVGQVDSVLALGVVVSPVLLVGEHGSRVVLIVDSELVLQHTNIRHQASLDCWLTVVVCEQRCYS